jgi:glycosyltransferase involved in cell wall biosynthesis
MKILHAPTNIGGMPYVMAKAQRALGYYAKSYSIIPSPFQYDIDIQLNVNKSSKDRKKAKFNAFKFALEYDVFQFYFGQSLTRDKLTDIPYLKKLNKKIIFHFCGCDIRDSKRVIAQYEISACKECWPMLCSQNQDVAYEMATKYADAVFVSTPDLLEFIPGAIWIPQPIQLEVFDEIAKNLKPSSESSTERIKIAHAPTNQKIKGSKYLIQAVEDLQSEGLPIELVLIENMPYHQALEAYASSDIIVDQLLVGWYGQVSLEMMALGKPVICYIREELRQHMPDEVPIVSADPLTIKQVLRDLILQRETWANLGANGRKYVEVHHDAKIVAQKTLEVYHRV